MLKKIRKYFSLLKIVKKLKADLQEAEFSRNWADKQKINLKLLWIDFLKKENEIISRGFGFTNEHQFFNDLRTDDDSYFPTTLNSQDLLHPPFAEKILQDYGSSLANPGKYEKCLYKPASYLPYPKQYIGQACDFMLQELKSDHSMWEPPVDADELAKKISAVKVVLSWFIEIEEINLPTDTLENNKVGYENSLSELKEKPAI